MTCIVGLVDNGIVYMGADSAGVSGWNVAIRADAKVFRNGDFLIGFTTSFRMGQLLQYSFVPPVVHDDLFRYMTTHFVNAVRDCLKAGGYAQKEKEAESGGSFLVGYKGRLFQISDDYQVGERLDYFDSIGVGSDFALGALHALADTDTKPAEKVLKALATAARFSMGVREPFDLEELTS